MLCRFLTPGAVSARASSKVSMALSLAIQKCGDTLPAYARVITSSLMRGTCVCVCVCGKGVGEENRAVRLC
jgi:hypothetical protein